MNGFYIGLHHLQNDISTHSAHSNYSGAQNQASHKIISQTPNLKKE